MSRIRWKLLTAMIVVVAVTLGLSGLLTRQVTHDQVRRLLVSREPAPSADLARPLEEFYRTAQGWNGVDQTLDRLAREFRKRIVLTTPDGRIIAVSHELRDATVRVEGENRVLIARMDRGQLMRIVVEIPPAIVRDTAGGKAGRAYFLPPDEPAGGLAVREFAALDRRLITTFAGAALVAALFAFVISRRITRPIERLTLAVRKIARGEILAHVEVSGSDEIAQLGESFNAMAHSIGRQEELRRRMVADVAHELRTPLTNLRCELEAVQDGLVPPDAARISSIHEEVLHLQRLVDDLQDLAVAEAGGLPLKRERIDLVLLVSRLVESFQSDGGRRRIAIGFSGGGRAMVEGDATRIAQIMRNLLSNAVSHTPAEGRVDVSVSAEGNNAVVSVADSGSGIPHEALDAIFERFYRLDEARGRESGGAGLGLAIVRRLVVLHGGRVWAENVEGSGARFTFTIPLSSS